MAGINIPEVSLNRNPPVGFHFAVVFFVGGVVPNPLDIRFQKVSGITAEMETIQHKEGGQNLYVHRLPSRVTYNNLTLERGMVSGSPLNIEVNVAFSTMQIVPGNVLVALLDDNGLPEAAWLFWKTYPVKWSISDFDADQNNVVIESVELSYTRFQAMKI